MRELTAFDISHNPTIRIVLRHRVQNQVARSHHPAYCATWVKQRADSLLSCCYCCCQFHWPWIAHPMACLNPKPSLSPSLSIDLGTWQCFWKDSLRSKLVLLVWDSHPQSGSLYTYIQKWVKFSSPPIGNFFVPTLQTLHNNIWKNPFGSKPKPTV